MLSRTEIRKTIQKALIFSLTVGIVITAVAVINYFFRSRHTINPETANVELNESYVEDGLYVFGSATLPYNTTVVNGCNTDVFVFVEFDSPIIGGLTVLEPQPASGWVLYNAGSASVDGQSVYRYIYANGSGTQMTSLASGDETGNVFSSVGVNSGLTEAQYKTLAEYPFNVAVRTAVTSASDGNIDTVWSQVEELDD